VQILVLGILILLNGLLAMSEIALVVSRKSRLTSLADEGNKAAITALTLAEDPTKFLSTIQIGITSIGILSGIVGHGAFAVPLSQWLQNLGFSPQTASVASTAVVVVLITYVSIVAGELVPKRIGQTNPEQIACVVSKPMQLLATLTRPFVLLLTFSTHALVQILGVKKEGLDDVSEEDIQALLGEGSQTGVIEKQQHTMFRNIFQLDDRLIGSLMVPRSDVVFLDTTLPVEENLLRVTGSDHSRFPVCDGSLDKPIGIIRANQLMGSIIKGETPDLRANLHPCTFVPETLTGLDLLEQFQTGYMEIAFVIDEYGEVQGVVTLHDLLQAVTGEFQESNPEDAWAVQREDGSWLLDGAIPITEMMDRLGLKSVPELERGHYHTVSGMVMLLLGRLPRTGDHVDWENWRFEVVDMDEKRIDKVLASSLQVRRENSI